MSVKLFGEDILFLQRFLKSAGFYTGNLDGIYGKMTDAALNAFECANSGDSRRPGNI